MSSLSKKNEHEKLPQALKNVHLASLMLVGLAVLLLMSPAAWHRMVEKGEDTERFVRVTSRYVIASLVPLALALSSELSIVLHRVAREPVCVALSAWRSSALRSSGSGCRF